MITIHISTTEQELIDLELEVFQAGKAYYESLGRTFIDDKLVSQLGGVNMPNEKAKTDYRQLVRFDDELQAFWIKSASNFGLDPAMDAPLQAILDSYPNVTTIEHEFPVIEEV